MDKQTLSNYGWLVIVTLVLAIMLALATPFGNYVSDAVVNVANGFVGTSNKATNEDNINKMQNKWESKLTGYVYYSSFEKAINDANNGTTENTDANQSNGVASISFSNKDMVVTLHKNIEIKNTVSITNNFTINFNNKTLTFSENGNFKIENVDFSALSGKFVANINCDSLFELFNGSCKSFYGDNLHFNIFNSGTGSVYGFYISDADNFSLQNSTFECDNTGDMLGINSTMIAARINNGKNISFSNVNADVKNGGRYASAFYFSKISGKINIFNCNIFVYQKIKTEEHSGAGTVGIFIRGDEISDTRDLSISDTLIKAFAKQSVVDTSSYALSISYYKDANIRNSKFYSDRFAFSSNYNESVYFDNCELYAACQSHFYDSFVVFKNSVFESAENTLDVRENSIIYLDNCKANTVSYQSLSYYNELLKYHGTILRNEIPNGDTYCNAYIYNSKVYANNCKFNGTPNYSARLASENAELYISNMHAKAVYTYTDSSTLYIGKNATYGTLIGTNRVDIETYKNIEFKY